MKNIAAKNIAKKFAVLATAISSLLIAPAVLAHAHLQQEMPAADSSVATSPTQLTLDFSEGLNLPLTGITLTGENGQKVATGAASLNPQNNKQLIVPLSTPLKAGQYHVDWKAVSVDGHKTHGDYHFSVK